MKKYGITVYFGAELSDDLNSQLQILKEVGFNEISDSFDYRRFSLKDLVETAPKYDLQIGSMHCKYKNYIIDSIWQNNYETERYIESLKEDISLCSKYNVSKLVVHIDNGNNTGHLTKEGIKNIKNLVAFAEKKKVILCIENTYSIMLIKEVLEKIKSPYLKMCLDIGHLHAVDKTASIEILNEDIFKNNIVFLHLHGNRGKTDEHLPLQYSNMNLKFFKEYFSKLDVTLTSETLHLENVNSYIEGAKTIMQGLQML